MICWRGQTGHCLVRDWLDCSEYLTASIWPLTLILTLPRPNNTTQHPYNTSPCPFVCCPVSIAITYIPNAHACEGQSVVCSPASLFDFIFAITLTTLLRYDTGVTISIYSYSAWRTARASLSLACVVQYLVKWRLEISSQASQHEKKSQISLSPLSGTLYSATG